VTTWRAYDAAADEQWDALVADGPMGTFLHTRRFLGYHGDRFADRSLLLFDDRSRLVGVFPAAEDPGEARRVVSHPGSTYGGLVHRGDLVGARAVEALETVRDAYAAAEADVLLYKAVPHIYHRSPSADDVYALHRLGARLVRCDLSCAIDLADRRPRSERRRRGEQKAAKHGVTLVAGAERVDELWPVVEENLAREHDARPTHTLAELQLLLSLFPDAIEIVTAALDSSVVAGVVLFKSARVVHAQYIASSEAGREVSGLDAVFEHCIERAWNSGARFFDFGISTEDEGRVLNETLYKFKSEFGGGGVVHEFFELELQP
jgi:Acetyltransferase (GNAT) domain